MAYREDPIREAAIAHTSLCLFSAIRQLSESSDINSKYGVQSESIAKACDAAMTRCLRDYDRAVAKIKDQK